MKFLLGRPLFPVVYACKKGVEIGLPICVLCHLAKSKRINYVRDTIIALYSHNPSGLAFQVKNSVVQPHPLNVSETTLDGHFDFSIIPAISWKLHAMRGNL